MFEKLSGYPGVVSRHREAPCASEHESYLAYRAASGAPLTTLHRFAREILVIARELDLKPKTISADAIESAAERWARRQRRRGRAGSLHWSRSLLIQAAQDWLRFLGRLQEPKGKAVPYATLIQDFTLFLRSERGLSDATMRNGSWPT